MFSYLNYKDELV